MLKRIFADNYRALVNFEFRPDRLCLLLGDNGSGKTSLFEVLATLFDHIIIGKAVSEVLPHTLTRWDKRNLQRFELDVEGNGGTYRYALEVEHAGAPSNKPFIRSESVTFDGNPLYRFAESQVQLFSDDQTPGPVFPFRSEQSFLPNVDENVSARLGWFKTFVAGIRILQPNPFAMALFSPQDEQPFLDRYGRNFPAFYNYLNAERPQERTLIESRLRDVLPGFRNLFFRRLGDEKLLLASFAGEQGEFEFNLLNLSEGQRVLIVLYAAVYALVGRATVLCFDEPDNFVSLAEIQPWLQALRDGVEQRGGQAMLVSHHPEVIDYLALDAVWRFERPSGPVVARRVELNGASELRLSEQIARGA